MVVADLVAALEAGGTLDFTRDPGRPVLRCPPGVGELARRLADKSVRADLRRALEQATAYRRALLALATVDPAADPAGHQRVLAEAEAVASGLDRVVVEAVRRTLDADAMGVRTQADTSSWVASYDARAICSSENKRPLSSAGVVASAHLDAVTVLEVLGDDPNAHQLACVHFDVAEAVARLDTGIRRGHVPPRQLVCGRPLADWLSLDDIARLLRGGA